MNDGNGEDEASQQTADMVLTGSGSFDEIAMNDGNGKNEASQQIAENEAGSDHARQRNARIPPKPQHHHRAHHTHAWKGGRVDIQSDGRERGKETGDHARESASP